MSEPMPIKVSEADTFTVYHADGSCAGRVCRSTGRAIIGDGFWRAERICRMKYEPEWSGDELYPTECYTCSECGHMVNEGKPKFCPVCGARVIKEES